MFIAFREAKCSRPRRIRAGHETFSHRQMTSPSGFTSVLSQNGHADGICHSGSPSGGRASSTGPSTFGMISPPFSIRTMSSGRMSRRLTSSSLWSVAIEIVVPPRRTGVRTAYGVTAPVRPTLTLMSSSRVTACSVGNLNATAHRGNFAVWPSRSRSARSSSLMTTPSVSNSRVRRSSRQRWQ